MNAGAEASTENLDNAFFLYGSPVQLRTVISSNRSHINLRDKTYVCAAFDASNSRDMGDSKPFAFPVNRFSNHILSYLTMQPPLHMTIGELILSFQRKYPTKSVEYLHRKGRARVGSATRFVSGAACATTKTTTTTMTATRMFLTRACVGITKSRTA